MSTVSCDSLLALAAANSTLALSSADSPTLLGEVVRRRRSRPQAESVDDQWAEGIFFHRPGAPAPGGVAGPPKARPVLDAIKAALTSFIGTAGPTLAPMLLQLITGLLGKWSSGVPSTVTKAIQTANGESTVALSTVSDDALAGALAIKYRDATGGVQAESVNPALDFGLAILRQILFLLGPDFEATVIGYIQQIFAAVAVVTPNNKGLTDVDA